MLSFILIDSYSFLFHITSSFQPKASISLATSHYRKARHAVASSKRYAEDNFGFVSSGISAVENDDHASVSFYGGSTYTNQKKQRKQVGKVAAPHARTVSHVKKSVRVRNVSRTM